MVIGERDEIKIIGGENKKHKKIYQYLKGIHIFMHLNNQINKQTHKTCSQAMLSTPIRLRPTLLAG